MFQTNKISNRTKEHFLFLVTCKLTIDNRIDSVKYNGASLAVTGVTNNWQKENSFTFSSCDQCKPGELVIQGYDYNGSNNCVWGGLILHCTAVDTSSPWHNFVSDTIHWKVSDGSTPCTNNAGMIPHAAAANINFIADLLATGAKKIWSNKKAVTLVGNPTRNCCKRNEDCANNLKCLSDCPSNLKCCNNVCKNPWECITPF